MHVQDSKTHAEENTEIGNDNLYFVGISDHSKASESGMKHFFVGQENNYMSDYIGSLAASNKYIREKRLPELPH